MKRQTQRGMKSMGTIFKLGAGIATLAVKEAKAQQREIAKQEAAYKRYLIQEERNRIRQIKQNEAEERRIAREKAKVERERQKEVMLQSKKQEQERLELEIESIEKENEFFRNIHLLCNPIISIEDINQEIENCRKEQEDLTCSKLFKKEYPEDLYSKIIANKEANEKYNPTDLGNAIRLTKEKLSEIQFNEPEPTKENVKIELIEQAKLEIKSFWPWKQKELRAEFVNSRIDSLFSARHSSWEERKNNYRITRREIIDLLEKQEKELLDLKHARELFFQRRTTELFDAEVNCWLEERNIFFETYQSNLQNIIDGGKEYINEAIKMSFTYDVNEFPFEYFVDVKYDEQNRRAIVNLDLPEIEDVPKQKVAITSTGKKSIRQKSQTDLRSDYANCVFGLAMYVADIIFNTSLQISEVEIAAFTQRIDNNSAVPSNQYVYLVNFSRNLFSKIDFSQLSSIQVMDFFKHYFNMTKSFDFKTIELSSAYTKMKSFITADYDEFIRVRALG